jgi:hypothetical protein
MVRKAAKYKVTLTDEERTELEVLISAGKSAARKLSRARILLKADAGPGGPAWDDGRISEALEVGRATVERVRKQFVEQGLQAALDRKKPDREYERRLDGQGEARLIALACSQTPEKLCKPGLLVALAGWIIPGHERARHGGGPKMSTAS